MGRGVWRRRAQIGACDEGGGGGGRRAIRARSHLFQSGSIFERRLYMTRVSQWCSSFGLIVAPSSIANSSTAMPSISLSMYW